jgi:hypothetical protein
MILRGVTLFVMVTAAVYITVAQGVRRFAALTQAPPSMREDLQFWGFVYMFVGSLIFTAACALGFYWLAKTLHKSARPEDR